MKDVNDLRLKRSKGVLLALFPLHCIQNHPGNLSQIGEFVRGLTESVEEKKKILPYREETQRFSSFVPCNDKRARFVAQCIGALSDEIYGRRRRKEEGVTVQDMSQLLPVVGTRIANLFDRRSDVIVDEFLVETTEKYSKHRYPARNKSGRLAVVRAQDDRQETVVDILCLDMDPMTVDDIDSQLAQQCLKV